MTATPTTTAPNDYHILYSFRRCPYAMRARMAIYTAELKCELREIVLRDKPAHMLQTSPKGTVPVLLTKSGSIIEESLDIMLYALSMHDPHNWLDEKEKSLDFIQKNDTAFKYALDRYKYPNRYPDEDCSTMRIEALALLTPLNETLASQSNLISNSRALADIAIFPFIRQFANVDRGWFDAQPLPHLQHWLADHINAPLFTAIFQKWEIWKDGDVPIIWPAKLKKRKSPRMLTAH